MEKDRTGLRVATANTYESRMLYYSHGLKPFLENGVDVLLMQEVLSIPREYLEERLARDGYSLTLFDEATGLAIATYQDSLYRPEQDSVRSDEIQRAERAGEFMRKKGLPLGNRLRQRGMIATRLTDGHHKLTVVTSHPIIFLRAHARAKQVKNISTRLQDPWYQEAPLILGGDMNHYPGPRQVDRRMYEATGLSMVEIIEPTWRIRGSKHEWLAAIGSSVLRKSMEDFDAQLDALLYRDLEVCDTSVIDIVSDHRAVIATFEPRQAQPD